MVYAVALAGKKRRVKQLFLVCDQPMFHGNQELQLQCQQKVPCTICQNLYHRVGLQQVPACPSLPICIATFGSKITSPVGQPIQKPHCLTKFIGNNITGLLSNTLFSQCTCQCMWWKIVANTYGVHYKFFIHVSIKCDDGMRLNHGLVKLEIW